MSYKDIQRIEKIRELNQKNREWINNDLYRLLYKKDLYVIAYEILKSNAGNMTKGSDGSTIDGFSTKTIDKIVEQMKDESFKFKPARRVEIPKSNGKTRPLGIASPVEKVVQQVILFILEAIYDPTFSPNSHGFRGNRGCHTALKDFRTKWGGVNWIIEGDIKGFFDNISHRILIDILKKRINDERFLNLIRKALNAGYLQFGTFANSVIGTPQGSVVSPILANIYLDTFDKYVEEEIIAKENKGKDKKVHPQRRSLLRKIEYRKTKLKNASNSEIESLKAEIKKFQAELINVPQVINDASYIRVKYIRYADDWIIGVNGPKELAEEIREKCGNFLKKDLELELSYEKTHIRHAKTEFADFLGTKLKVGSLGEQKVATYTSKNGHRFKKKVTGWTPYMAVPIDKLVKRLSNEGICKSDGTPICKNSWMLFDDTQIVNLFSSIWRGLLNYYSFVDNRTELRRIQYILLYSCARTLAGKHHTSVHKLFKKHGKRLKIQVKNADNKVIHVTEFHLVKSLKRDHMNFRINDSEANNGGKTVLWIKLKTKSKLNFPCCICGEKDNIEMHHVKHVRKMGEKVKGFTKLMATLNRKQIPVCRKCHVKIHNGLYDGLALSKLAHPELAAA